MKVQFVGHASIIVEVGNAKVLCDPWLFGKVFNDGWALASESYKPDFSQITHIWISHEHPDHLHFPSLKSIPESERKRITVLHQRHASPRVVDSIRKLGFTRINELPLYAWRQLTDGVRILCGSAGSMDSFLVVRDDKHTLLNLNDCVLNPAQLRYIQRKVGQVDILFTQFSFAGWVGNDADEIHGAEQKILQLRTQIEIFKPRYTVPFASFVYFCNQENSRMNKWANTPDTIAALGLPGINFMYPGDLWDADAPAFDTASALDHYRADYAHTTIDPTPPSKDIADVEAAVAQRLGDLKAKLKQPFLNRLAPFAVYVHDLGKVIEIDPPSCTYKIVDSTPEKAKAARYAMCSQVAWFTFRFPYGGGTTAISGMYLDRDAEKLGANQFFTLQTRLATEIFEFKGLKGSLRTANFWWRKKGELWYRVTDRRNAPPGMDD
jgi:UDP-MurNAc hydroxylase